jgi:hypothetical protein
MTDLTTLMQNLRPTILPDTYVFCSVAGAKYGALSHTDPMACFAEPEGLSLVITQNCADQEGVPYQGTFRCISLQVHSSLQAVGLTAAVASELAAHNISANVIAGTHHDHVFVPSSDASLALEVLESMSAGAR